MLVVGFWVECCCCVEGVVDDDSAILAAGGEWDGVFAILAEGEIDGVGGIGDIEFAQETGDVEDECRGLGVEPIQSQVVVGGHLGCDRADACFLGVAGVDVGGGTVADTLQDERCAADEFDVAMNVPGRQPVGELMEEGLIWSPVSSPTLMLWPGCVRG